MVSKYNYLIVNTIYIAKFKKKKKKGTELKIIKVYTKEQIIIEECPTMKIQ